MLELGQQDFIKATKTVYMQVGFPALQMHGEYQPCQSQVMISVEVTDKNLTDLLNVDREVSELQLRPFSTIYQKVMVLYVEILGRRKSAVCRQCSTGAEDSEFE